MRFRSVFCFALLGAVSLVASSTQTWELDQYSDFLTGKFHNVALDREGRLRAAPALTKIHETDQSVVWTIVEGPDGTVYFGTGHQGAVYSVSPDGDGKLVWKAPEIEVFAMAVGPDERLYVGTSPHGKVYRLAGSGGAEEFFDPEDTYIWSLVFDAGGHLIVGTGDKGKIHRVAPGGESELWFDSKQRHVMSLALDPEGRVLAGADPAGILYRIDGQGRAFALYDADLPEIRSVEAAADGTIYFAAMGGGMDRVLQTVPKQPQAAVGQPQGAVAGSGAASAAGAAAGVTAQALSSISYAQPLVTYGVERGAVLRLEPGRAVEKLWTSTEENILGLSLPDPTRPRVRFASDRYGRLYEVDQDRRLSIVTQTDKPQITAMARTQNGMLLGSAHGGNLFRLDIKPAPEGSFETAVHDTGGVSAWGRLSWRAAAPEGSSVGVETRSGNSYRPDESWSGWSQPITDSDGASISSPAARFLQWRATLKGAAVLDSVRVSYLPQNSAPLVRSVTVVPETPKSSDASAASAAPSDTTSSYSITVSASGAASAPTTTTKETPLGAGAQRNLAVSWKAEDPDGDQLIAEVAFRGQGETAWKTYKKDIKESKVTIDSDALADGRYFFLVRVDDAGVNPAGRALKAEKISAPVLIDHTPPRIALTAATTQAEVHFEAQDFVSELVTAEYSIDAGEWRPINADDGIIDSKTEQFTIVLGELGEGEHMIAFRVRDRAGNAALGKTLRR